MPSNQADSRVNPSHLDSAKQLLELMREAIYDYIKFQHPDQLELLYMDAKSMKKQLYEITPGQDPPYIENVKLLSNLLTNLSKLSSKLEDLHANKDASIITLSIKGVDLYRDLSELKKQYDAIDFAVLTENKFNGLTSAKNLDQAWPEVGNAIQELLELAKLAKTAASSKLSSVFDAEKLTRKLYEFNDTFEQGVKDIYRANGKDVSELLLMDGKELQARAYTLHTETDPALVTACKKVLNATEKLIASIESAASFSDASTLAKLKTVQTILENFSDAYQQLKSIQLETVKNELSPIATQFFVAQLHALDQAKDTLLEKIHNESSRAKIMTDSHSSTTHKMAEPVHRSATNKALNDSFINDKDHTATTSASRSKR